MGQPDDVSLDPQRLPWDVNTKFLVTCFDERTATFHGLVDDGGDFENGFLQADLAVHDTGYIEQIVH